MTPEEEKEFTELKFIRSERGFWTDQERERWEYLHTLHGEKVIRGLTKYKQYLDELRKSELN
jgi:hypothetical protein